MATQIAAGKGRTVLQQSEITVGGCKIGLRRGGSGEPLLFLHGAQGLAHHEPGLEALAAQFDVIAPDHPGFGRSDVAEAVDDIADLALFYLDLLDALKLQRVHLVGQCLGGWLALEIAIRNTARIKSLVLLNAAGLRVKGVPRADMFACSEDDLLKLLFAGDGGAEWLRSWRANPDSEDIYDRNRAAAARYSWSPRLCNPKLDHWLHRVDVPTHVVWGERNRVIPPAYGAALKDLIPRASIATLPDCAHLAHLEQPQAFAGEVSQFIRSAAR
jgi:pimeloyl-ACP methyl ester carboxylesterase